MINIEELDYTTPKYYLEDEFFIFDLLYHEALLKGELPDGYSVVYENNIQRDLGKHEYTASIYDEKGILKETLKAFITIYDEDKGEENYYKESRFDYLNKDYTITHENKHTTITFSSKNQNTDIIVPEVVDGFIVDSLVVDGECEINTLFISKYIKYITLFSRVSIGFIKHIVVDSENPYYKVAGDFLLNKKGEVRYYFGEGDTLTFPPEVKAFNIRYLARPVRKIVGGYSLKEFRAACATNFSVSTHVEEIYLENTQVDEIVGFGFGFLNLEKITLPRHLKELREGVFQNCHRLKEIKIPQSVNKIGIMAFDSCKSLEEITIPEGVECIKENTFNNCRSLESVTLPESLDELDVTAFTGCTSLKKIYINSKKLLFNGEMWYFLKDSKKPTVYVKNFSIYEMMEILKDAYNLDIIIEKI